MKILEIFFIKFFCVDVHVHVAVQLLKLLFRCFSSVHSDVIRTQIKLHAITRLPALTICSYCGINRVKPISQLRFDYDTTTTRLRRKIGMLLFACVE